MLQSDVLCFPRRLLAFEMASGKDLGGAEGCDDGGWLSGSALEAVVGGEKPKWIPSATAPSKMGSVCWDFWASGWKRWKRWTRGGAGRSSHIRRVVRRNEAR